jgi:NAD(P)H-dependent FMN reductase
MKKKVLIIVGSLREKSFNRQLAKVAEEFIKEYADVTFLEYGDIPYMNQDIEFPAPKSIQRVRDSVMEADGIWIMAPEYNHSYTGVLKNLLDWLSRPFKANDFSSGTAIFGKKVTISGVGGLYATLGSRTDLKELLSFIKADVMGGTQVGIKLTEEEFATDVLVLTDEQREELQKQADEFIKFISQ